MSAQPSVPFHAPSANSDIAEFDTLLSQLSMFPDLRLKVAQHLNYDDLMSLGAACPDTWKEDIEKDFTIPGRYSRDVLLSRAWREMKPNYTSYDLFRASLTMDISLHSFLHAVLSLQCDEHGNALIAENLDESLSLRMGGSNAALEVDVDLTEMNCQAEWLKFEMDERHVVVYSSSLALVVKRRTGEVKHRIYNWSEDVSLQKKDGALFTVMRVRRAADLRVTVNRLHESGDFVAEPYSPISVENTSAGQINYGNHDFYLTQSHLLVTWNHQMDCRIGGIQVVELATKKTVTESRLFDGGIEPYKNFSKKTFTTCGKVILPAEVRCFKVNKSRLWLFNEWTGLVVDLGPCYGVDVEYSRTFVVLSYRGSGSLYCADLRQGYNPRIILRGGRDLVPQLIVGERFLVVAYGEDDADHQLLMCDLSASRPSLQPVGRLWRNKCDCRVSLRTMRVSGSGDGFVVSAIRGVHGRKKGCEEGVLTRYTFESVAGGKK